MTEQGWTAGQVKEFVEALLAEQRRPAASATPRTLIFVSDAAGGSRFQASDGTNWVALG